MPKKPEYCSHDDAPEGWEGYYDILWKVGGPIGNLLATFVTWQWVSWQVGLGIFFLGSGICLSIWVVRERRSWEFQIGKNLHDLTHTTRDSLERIMEVLNPSDPASESRYADRLDFFNQDLADRIAIYFRSLFRDGTIHCAIRLAEEVNGDRVYTTVGRSKGMDLLRVVESEDIPSEKGIAHSIKFKKNLGVFIIRSIPDAIDEGVWEPTSTDNFKDVVTLIVSPINGYGESGEKSMFGLLYITSQWDRFKKRHTNHVKGIADYLGTIYPWVVGNFENSKEG